MNSDLYDKVKQRLSTMKPTLGGRILYTLIPFRRRVVLQNMQQVFEKHLSLKEIKKLRLCFYSHLFKSIVENISMRFMSTKTIKAKAEVVGKNNIWQVVDLNRGVLILTGHFGNWEFAPIAGMLNFTTFQGRYHFIRRSLGNKFIEKILFRRYFKAGIGVVPKKHALDQVYQLLDKNDVIVFIMDQHANIKNRDGITAEFFGKQAGTYRSLTMIARDRGIPVIPAYSYRRTDGKHVLQFKKPLTWIPCENVSKEIEINTRAYNKALEEMILTYPEQWLWMHKRWKLALS